MMMNPAARRLVSLSLMVWSAFGAGALQARTQADRYELVVSGGRYAGQGCTVLEPGAARPAFRRSMEPRRFGSRAEICRLIQEGRQAGHCRHVGRRTRDICNAPDPAPAGAPSRTMHALGPEGCRPPIKRMVTIVPASQLKASNGAWRLTLDRDPALDATIFGRFGRGEDVVVNPNPRDDGKVGVCQSPSLAARSNMRMLLQTQGTGHHRRNCSGTVVNTAHGAVLLTAAHCVNPALFDVGVQLPGGGLQMVGCVVPAAFNTAQCPLGATACPWDIAVCQLPGASGGEEMVPSDAKPPARATLTIAGFGASPTAEFGDFCAGTMNLVKDGFDQEVSRAESSGPNQSHGTDGDSGGAVFWEAAAGRRWLLGVPINFTTSTPTKASWFLDLRSSRLRSFIDQGPSPPSPLCL